MRIQHIVSGRQGAVMMWAIKDPEKIKESVIRPRRGSLKGNEVRGKPKFFFLLYLCGMHKCVLMVGA